MNGDSKGKVYIDKSVDKNSKDYKRLKEIVEIINNHVSLKYVEMEYDKKRMTRYDSTPAFAEFARNLVVSEGKKNGDFPEPQYADGKKTKRGYAVSFSNSETNQLVATMSLESIIMPIVAGLLGGTGLPAAAIALFSAIVNKASDKLDKANKGKVSLLKLTPIQPL
ncbi:hypothetical protein A374_01374 [Fictibacillus macauensis ZFHKF-1]|uniref:Uncharacterized protein n=1 Tax=Fictibacillus macauensis ZFHKF-1 TaxID=1196324 RepID=I8UK11_9BACL|nr:hypothetical protein [Fictibacillus macauensis]EIT87225.1 hypothetical protein A374_01374 [Fictibacillus macauensis ZFHKF-1]